MYSRPFWTSKVQLVIFLVPKSLGFWFLGQIGQGFFFNFFIATDFSHLKFFQRKAWSIKLKKKTFWTCIYVPIYLIYHFWNQIHHYLFGSQMIDFDNSFPIQTQKNASINNLSCTFFKFKIAHNDIGVPNTLFGSICSNQLGVLKESDNCK